MVAVVEEEDAEEVDFLEDEVAMVIVREKEKITFKGDRRDYNDRNNRNESEFRGGKTTYGDVAPMNGDLSAPPRENGGGRPEHC